MPGNTDEVSRKSLLTEMALATGRGDVRIMMGLPFAKTSSVKRGTQSLPDKRTLDRQRVHRVSWQRAGSVKAFSTMIHKHEFTDKKYYMGT